MTEDPTIPVLGIDPGSRTGLALWNGYNWGTANSVLLMTTCNRDQVVDEIEEYYDGKNLKAVGIEYQENTHIWPRPGASPQVMIKIAQNVERNRADARELIKWCGDNLNCPVYTFDPFKLKGCTKRAREVIEFIYGYPTKRPSSEHSRDALGIADLALSTYNLHSKLEPEEEKDE